MSRPSSDIAAIRTLLKDNCPLCASLSKTPQRLVSVRHCCEPRGLSRVDAAFYIGIGTTFFDQLVEDGRMPKPFRIGSRVLWDCKEIDDSPASRLCQTI